MKSKKLTPLRRARARKRREGIVLLVVVTVLMLITSTAIFAVQQTMWEMRAGGSANQALTTRYTAEAYATLSIAGLSAERRQIYLDSTTPTGVTGGWQDKYGLPEYGAQHDYVSVARNTDYICPLGFWCSGAPLGPENNFPAADIGPYEGLAGPLTEVSMATVERWVLTGTNDPTPEVRYIVTAYGAMAPVGDVNEDLAVDATTTVAGETGRTVEETISISRAYYTAPE